MTMGMSLPARTLAIAGMVNTPNPIALTQHKMAAARITAHSLSGKRAHAHPSLLSTSREGHPALAG